MWLNNQILIITIQNKMNTHKIVLLMVVILKMSAGGAPC